MGTGPLVVGCLHAALLDRGLAAGHRAGAAECVPFSGRGQASAGANREAGTSFGVDRGALVLAEEVTMDIDNGEIGPDKR